MAGVGISVDWDGLKEAIDRIDDLSPPDPKMLDAIGSLLISQTQRRIKHEKRDPEGNPWQPWSENYARTRHSGHSLLENAGPLHDSINAVVSGGKEIVWGSNLIYARPHQLGYEAGGIPARPYIGISQENAEEIEAYVADVISEVMATGRARDVRGRFRKSLL